MPLIQNMPEYEKPREKAMNFGMHSLSNRELLALLIRTGSKNHSSLDIASELLKETGSLGGIFSLESHELKKFRGISDVKAMELHAVGELMKRIQFETIEQKDVITCPQNFIHWLELEIGYSKVENFMIVFLDHAHHILSHEILSTGTVDSTSVYPREIMKKALIKGASAIIAVHNHPSQTLQPSLEDKRITNEIKEAGKTVGVEVLDHMIVTSQGVYSIMYQ